MQRRFLLSAVFAALAFLTTDVIGAPICFSPHEESSLPFAVIVNAPPPKNKGEEGWRYRPATAAASMDIRALNVSQEAALKKYWFLWANRCQGGERGQPCGGNPKGNIIYPRKFSPDGSETRAYFTSVEKANACTMAQAAFALGIDERNLETKATNTGVKLIKEVERSQQYNTPRLVDVCLLPEERLSADVNGVVLDYEVQDGRSSEQTERFLTEFARLMRAAGRRSILYTNPLDAPTQRATGLAAGNIPRIAFEFDAISIMLWHGNKQKDLKASAESQMRLLKNIESDKVVIVYEISGTSLRDAQDVHDLMLREKYSAVMLWRNSAEVGGSCTSDSNRKLACLIFRQCN